MRTSSMLRLDTGYVMLNLLSEAHVCHRRFNKMEELSNMTVYDVMKFGFTLVIILIMPVVGVLRLCSLPPRQRCLQFCPMLLLFTAVVCSYLRRLTLNYDGLDQQYYHEQWL